jgi:thiol-disulfide isomerase/thioredoxin
MLKKITLSILLVSLNTSIVFCEATAIQTDSNELTSFARSVRPKGSIEEINIEEWPVAAVSEVGIPDIKKEELLQKVKASIEAHKSLRSWEAEYRLLSQKTEEAHFILSEQRWFLENREKYTYITDGKESGQKNYYRYACDGENVIMLWPEERYANVKHNDNFRQSIILLDFLPWLSAGTNFRQGYDFPDLEAIIEDANISIASWRTEVGGDICYVLERIIRTEIPVFTSQEEADRWCEENPTEKTRTIDINPYAKHGDARVTVTRDQIAIDPRFGFSIVRWAEGAEIKSPMYNVAIFPVREITYSGFKKISNSVFIPHLMEYVDYRRPNGAPDKQTVTIEKFLVNQTYEKSLFEPVIPDGYQILDSEREIVYTKGDPQDKIDLLLKAAETRRAFYDNLMQASAPSLEASQWLNTEPISLSEHKGRKIILHFWGIGCGPCVAELPRLQNEYENSIRNTSGPLFISIHQYVEGYYLEQLKDLISENSITFPVMIDKAQMPYWGKTFMKYKVLSMPQDIIIDKTGRIDMPELGYISESNWWVQKVKGIVP